MAERVVVVVAAAYPGAGCRAGEGSGSCIIRASVGDGNVLRTRAAPFPTIVAQDVHSTLHQLVWNRVVANWPDLDANKPQPPPDPLFICLALIPQEKIRRCQVLLTAAPVRTHFMLNYSLSNKFTLSVTLMVGCRVYIQCCEKFGALQLRNRAKWALDMENVDKAKDSKTTRTLGKRRDEETAEAFLQLLLSP